MYSSVPYGGWRKCLRLTNGTIELIATTEVGPRIIRFGFVDGPNEFVEYPDQRGTVGGDVYRSYGGHRLWVAPETDGWTNHPDNQQVSVTEEGDTLVLTAAVEAGTGLQKQFRVSFLPDETGVRVQHMITNAGPRPVQLAPWALSVMAAGGTAMIPHEPYIPHPEKVLPARPMALWHYTDMTDPRWTWGRELTVLRQVPGAKTPQKIGAWITNGWAAYHNGDRLFVKRFPCDPSAQYPDFGVNAELFTNHRMLEVESLGALVTLLPSASTSHTEHWYLFRSVEPAANEEGWMRKLSEVILHTSHPEPPDRTTVPHHL